MATCSVVALSALSSSLPNAADILLQVSQLEEFQVGTVRTVQVLQHIQQLLALKDHEQTKLHGLIILLEKR